MQKKHMSCKQKSAGVHASVIRKDKKQNTAAYGDLSAIREDKLDIVRNLSWFFALILPVVFFFQVFAGSRHESLTWDEPSFISAGYTYLTLRDFSLNPSHPPLMQDLEAFPLLFMNLNVPPVDLHIPNPVLDFGRKFIFYYGNDPLSIAFWSRLPVMLLGTGLIVSIFCWGRKLYGAVPALLGTAVASLSPNLIAHSRLATEDMGCTALVFIAVWTFWQCFHKKEQRYYFLCGIVTGLALVSKYTALVLLPIYFLLTVAQYVRDSSFRSPKTLLKMYTVIFICTFCVISTAYLGRPWIYLTGLGKIYTDLIANPFYYFLGEVVEKPLWYYYIVVFFAKVPEPTLVLIILAGILGARSRRHREATLFLIIPAAIIVAVSCFDKANFGLRRILPAFPFLFLFVSQVIADDFRWAKLASLALLVWLGMISWRIYPHDLSYFNSIAGGPENAPYLFNDSNVDWGQDLPSLAVWQKQHPETSPLKLAYFGPASPQAYGVHAIKIDLTEIEHPTRGFYAISVNNLVFFRQGMYKSGMNIDWLTKYKPIDHAGYSIYIYEFK